MPRLLMKSLIVAAALAAVLTAPASAHDTKKQSKKSTMVQAASFSIGRQRLLSPGITKVYLGRAPYICGPSGFGRKSRCFQRSGI